MLTAGDPHHGIVRYMANPLSLGGDFDLRLVKLSPEHLAQTDKSLNARLWKFFPLTTQEQVDIMTRLPNFGPFEQGPPFDISAHVTAATEMEERFLTVTPIQLRGLWPLLFVDALRRKLAAEVEPLTTVIRQVTEKKRRTNAYAIRLSVLADGRLYEKKEYLGALLGYVECLADMMPWYATPLFMTAQQCYDSGLAELEASLWNNLYMAAAKAPEVPRDFPMIGFEPMHHMRYAPINMLYKCRHRFNQLVQKEPQVGKLHPQDEREFMLEATEAMVDKTSKAWAHEHCITEHVCFNQEFVKKMRAWERRFEEERKAWELVFGPA